MSTYLLCGRQTTVTDGSTSPGNGPTAPHDPRGSLFASEIPPARANRLESGICDRPKSGSSAATATSCGCGDAMTLVAWFVVNSDGTIPERTRANEVRSRPGDALENILYACNVERGG